MKNIAHDLFLLMNTLFQIKNKKRILTIFTDAINTLHPEIKIELSEKELPKTNTIPICTTNNSFGHIITTGDLSKLGDDFSTLLQNAVQLLAIILEKLAHDKLLADEKLTLKELINKKTTALQKSEDKFRNYIDNAPDGIFVANKRGDYTEVNRAASEITGYSRKELLSMNLIELIPPEDRLRAANSFRQVRTKGYASNETLFIKKDGTTHCWLVDAVKLSENQFIGFVKDITERKKAEQQIQQDLKEKIVLLKEIHHRVKNNLNVIMSLLSLQADKIQNKEQAITAFKISKSRILAMSLVHERIYKTGDFSNIDMKSYIEDISEDLMLAYSTNDETTLSINATAIDIDINKAIPCGLILNELITNALKHAFPNNQKGEIQIIFKKKKNGDYLLSVSDNGISLPLKKEIDSQKSLGLELVNILAAQIQGKLSISRKNGTKFEITF